MHCLPKALKKTQDVKWSANTVTFDYGCLVDKMYRNIRKPNVGILSLSFYSTTLFRGAVTR